MDFIDDAAGAAYLEPQGFDNRRKLTSHYSVNDSGVVDMHGSHNSSKIGLSVPNDCYRGCESDQENLPITPCSPLYPALHRANSHTPIAPQFSFPYCGSPSGTKNAWAKPYEGFPNSNRNRDDHNLYTSIDEGSVIFSNDHFRKSEEAEPFTKPNLVPRQLSVDSGNRSIRGRENPIYDHRSDAFMRRQSQTKEKKKPCLKMYCLVILFGLIATSALVLAIINLLARFAYDESNDQYMKLEEDYKKLEQNYRQLEQKFETLNQTQQLAQNIKTDSNPRTTPNEVENTSFQPWCHNQDNTELTQNLIEAFENKTKAMLGRILPINVSACEENYKSHGSTPSLEETQSPTITLNGVFVLYVFCTTEGGMEAQMQYDPTNKPNQYKCICRGRRPEVTSRYCTIHWKSCPYIRG